VKAAREKAEALAKAVGQDIGKAQTIEEGADSEYTRGIFANAGLSFEVRDKSVSPSLAAGQKTISASVTVSFELN